MNALSSARRRAARALATFGALVQQRASAQAQGQQAQPGQPGNAQDDKAMQDKAGPPSVDAERIVGEAQNAQVNPQAAKQQAQDADPQRRAYRQAVMEFMRAN